jgi:protein-S-isoprenylcysteine O-methyltransferase Ste14
VQDQPFRVRWFYKLVRHPIMLGFFIAFWAVPTMTLGHLIFSIGMTVYIFIGLIFEERDLVTQLGDDYVQYQRRVPMLIPFTKRGE